MGFWIVLIPVFSTILDEFLFKSSGVLAYTLIIVGYSLTFYFGRKLNKNPIRRYKNVKTNEIFEQEEKHDFFFIPMEYWSFFILVIVVIVLICKFVSYLYSFF